MSVTGFGAVAARNTPASDRKFCEKLLPEVSRTFALSIGLLPKPLRDAVGVSYLLCRVVDSIEDDASLSATDRTALFDAFDRTLGDDDARLDAFERVCVRHGVGSNDAERSLCAHAGAVFRTFRRLPAAQRDAIRPSVLTMSTGMREYCLRTHRDGQLRIADLEDLERYCYFVAGTVGELLTALFERSVRDLTPALRERIRAHSVAFGLGLQLVNIVKDVAEDATRSVCFLPVDLALREGIALDRVCDPSQRDGARRVISAVTARAEAHLVRAREYTLAWPEQAGADVRLFCAVPLALAFATLREVRAGNRVLEPGGTPKISRTEVAAIVASAKTGAGRNDALQRLFERCGAPPMHVRSDGVAMLSLDDITKPTRPSHATPATYQRTSARTALERSRDFLLRTQAPEGYWKGELQTNVTMDAEDLLLRHFLGIRTDDVTRRAAEWIRSQQREDGTWANAFGAPADLSTTVESYVALKLAGDSIDAPHMKRAAEWIRREGGVPAARVFTRIWLALVGLWSWDNLPVLPPEMMLLPPSVPLNIYDFACWARQTIGALTIVMTYKPVRPVAFDLAELDVPAAPRKTPANWRGRAFEAIDSLLKVYQRRPIASLRERALREAERWILQRQEADGSWGGIQPPWVYSLMALHLRGYALDHPAMRAGIEGLERFTIHDGSQRRLEACQSPVWDTAYAVLALADAGVAGDDPAMVRAGDWLMQNEVRVRGDWSVRRPTLEPGGWAFEFANVNYPDIDDTAEVVLALRRVRHPDPQRLESVITRGVTWILGMRSRDGGWGAFDADNMRAICRDIPFCDFGEVIDEPSADVTAHVVELLAREGLNDHASTRGGIRWLLDHQETDGSWFGRWGVNYVYGTGAALMAFGEAGIEASTPAIRRAVAWLEAHQNDDGGWGEDVRSYDDRAWAGRGDSTASQTAWALLGLLAVGERSTAVERGVAWLCATQRQDGSWDEKQFTGTGFPGDFYINYHLYRQVFPTMALGRYVRAKAGDPSGSTSRASRRTDETLVVAPLRVEAMALRAGRDLRIERTGMGARRTREAATRLASDAAGHVVVAGFCGAVDFDLEPGDVVVASEVQGPDGTHVCDVDGLVAALEAEGLRVLVAPIRSVDRIVGPAERKSLMHDGAKAVDMESAWFAPLAHDRRFSVVRVVVDAPGRELLHPWHTLTGGVRGWRSLRKVGQALKNWSQRAAVPNKSATVPS